MGRWTQGPTRRALVLGGLGASLTLTSRAEPIGAVRDYERDSGGHVGFWARNLFTGAQIGWRADERFVLCSTFKMSLGALVLHRVDRGQDSLDTPIRFTAADVPDWYAPVAKANIVRGEMTVAEMCRAAVQQSDNSCANLLLGRVGGPDAVTHFWRDMGDRASRLDDGEPMVNRTQLGGLRNTTTPQAMAEIMGQLVEGDVLAPDSRAKLKDWLVACTTGLTRLRAGLPPGWIAGDKTGNNGADIAADVMIAWPPNGGGPIVVSAYTRGGQPTPAAFAPLFNAIAREATAQLS